MRTTRAFGGATLVAIAACAGVHPATPQLPTPQQRAASRACLVTDSAGPSIDTVHIAVQGSLHSRLNAPIAGDFVRNSGEGDGDRFVFRQLYATLVRVDCQGTLMPGLATSWTPDETRSVWTFELVPGITFAGGLPIDAAAIVAGWERQLRGPVAWPHVSAVEAAGVRSVRIRFDAPEEDGPRLLSDPHFAIVGPPALNGAPAESGPFTIDLELSSVPAGTTSGFVLQPRDSGAHLPVLDVGGLPPGTDLRDVLDRGIKSIGLGRASVAVTRDADVLAYAGRRDDLRAVPLPWDRTYVLVAPASLDTLTPPLSSLFPAPSERNALARDAVRSDARGAEPPFWWQRDSTCIASAPRPSSVRPVVGYRADDPIAKELAERIVALASSAERPGWIPTALKGDARSPLRVAPLEVDSLDDAMASGRVSAAVASYPRNRPVGCAFGPRRVLDRVEIPLVDSRPHVIVRRGVSFYIEGDGSIRFAPGRSP